ncbi:alpha/beta hydrolase [Bacillus sp. FJAT-47783]|uniref:alpha/beta fold hydrolase n=1 Tax=Bacillus sp. FJAT-47783 TaxID=2922712 RepID=UPI001FACB97F|nr:alpha/beta hydrolase [Bacillus sp. FJAT-47783]
MMLAYVTMQNGIRTYYEQLGHGEPILFIHPPCMGHVTFYYQRKLSRHYQLLFYDLRGNGKSSTNEQSFTMRALADDINDLLQQIGISEVFVCGYSNGGSIAQEFAIRYPKKVKGLILIGGFSEINSVLLHSEYLLGIMTSKLGGIPLLAKVISKAHAPTNDFQQKLEQYMKMADAKTILLMYQIGLKYVATDRLQNITSPVLLIYGQEDHYVHHYQDPFIERIQDVDVVYVSNVKHQVPTLQAQALNQIIHQFIQKQANSITIK